MYHLGVCESLSCMVPLNKQYIDKNNICALVPLYIEGKDNTLVVFISGEQIVIQESVDNIIRIMIKEQRRLMSLIWKFAEEGEVYSLDPISLDSYHTFKKIKCCITRDESKSYGYINVAAIDKYSIFSRTSNTCVISINNDYELPILQSETKVKRQLYLAHRQHLAFVGAVVSERNYVGNIKNRVTKNNTCYS